jgi:hypothetical protein
MLIQTWVLCRRTIRRTRTEESDDERAVAFRSFARAIEGCLIVVVVGGTFLHVQYSEMMWHVFGLAIALDIVVQQRTLVVASAGASGGPVIFRPGSLAPASMKSIRSR